MRCPFIYLFIFSSFETEEEGKYHEKFHAMGVGSTMSLIDCHPKEVSVLLSVWMTKGNVGWEWKTVYVIMILIALQGWGLRELVGHSWLTFSTCLACRLHSRILQHHPPNPREITDSFWGMLLLQISSSSSLSSSKDYRCLMVQAKPSSPFLFSPSSPKTFLFTLLLPVKFSLTHLFSPLSRNNSFFFKEKNGKIFLHPF